jgi:hypothetical protein
LLHFESNAIALIGKLIRIFLRLLLVLTIQRASSTTIKKRPVKIQSNGILNGIAVRAWKVNND